MLPIRNIWMIKLFMNRGQIRLLNSKTTDLNWYYSKPYQKLKLLIRNLLFTTCYWGSGGTHKPGADPGFGQAKRGWKF